MTVDERRRGGSAALSCRRLRTLETSFQIAAHRSPTARIMTLVTVGVRYPQGPRLSSLYSRDVNVASKVRGLGQGRGQIPQGRVRGRGQGQKQQLCEAEAELCEAEAEARDAVV